MNDESPWPLWTAPQEHADLGLAAPCPGCGVPVRPDQRYCENCGADVHPFAVGAPAAEGASEITVKLNRPRPSAAPCLECGGVVDSDGYCQTCGAKAPSPRDHFETAPAAWVGGVSDRGVVHTRNEDAMAAWAAPEPERSAVLVVCDGVSSSQDSDVASLAAAERARDVLVARLSGAPEPAPRGGVAPGMGSSGGLPGVFAASGSDTRGLTWDSDSRELSVSKPLDVPDETTRLGSAEPLPRGFSSSTPLDAPDETTRKLLPPTPGAAETAALIRAAAEAQRTVVEHTAPDSSNAASCTFAAAIVTGDRIVWANLGDSRVYFLGDDGSGVQLSTDHSVAEELIKGGVPRADAERSRQAHAITRWLGRDADDTTPDVGVHTVTGDGWLLVCSDGLWNYASEPAALATQLRAASEAGAEPVRVASGLVRWANAQGGKDNVTVVLARLAANLNGTSRATEKD